MQDRYTGDIGDFGKLGLLRALNSYGLSIGVNWYLVPDEKNNGDGRYTDYLTQNDVFQRYDDELWSELKHVIESGRRQVSALENDRILKARFYSAVLAFSGMTKQQRIDTRGKWHREALIKLSGVDLIFADPDNGLVVPTAKGKPKENKYVKPTELSDYYKQGSSVVYYQHKARRKDPFYVDEFHRLIRNPEFDDASGIGLKFVKTSQRYYFFILQPSHMEAARKAIDLMLHSEWSDLFTIVCNHE